jgi:hypothetical protein
MGVIEFRVYLGEVRVVTYWVVDELDAAVYVVERQDTEHDVFTRDHPWK